MLRLVPPLFRLLSCLPLRLLHGLGKLTGLLAYLLSPRLRHRTREHLALAYPQGIPHHLAWRSAMHAGRALLELPWLWAHPIEETVARVTEVEGLALTEAVLAEGRAILFLTPHLGCFEIAAQYFGTRHPLTVLYRPPRKRELAPMMEHGRVRGRMCAAPANAAGVKQMLRALRQGESVGMLPDQVPQRGEGIWSPFFGRPAFTMTLAARFAALDNVVTMIAYAERLPGAHYRMVFRHLRAPLSTDLPARVAQLNAELETVIRECPEQYLWSYNRYKRPAGVDAPEAT